PRINAPIMPGDYAGGFGIGSNPSSPGPNALPPGTSYPDTSDYKAWLLNLPRYKEYGQWGFRSFHPGGANFLFGDGSVKFIKESISMGNTSYTPPANRDIGVYRKMSTIAGGEVISADAY